LFFLHTLSTPLAHLLLLFYAVCKELIRFLTVAFASFSLLLHLLFRGVCFKSGCKDKQFSIPAKYFQTFFRVAF